MIYRDDANPAGRGYDCLGDCSIFGLSHADLRIAFAKFSSFSLVRHANSRLLVQGIAYRCALCISSAWPITNALRNRYD